MEYRPTIGLEVHAELKTRTKMFCDSLSDADEDRPNINVCPVCLAHPGALPTINKLAVEHVIRVGLAVGGVPNVRAKFDRKNYFYPDSPKAYQISQSGEPLVLGGALKNIKINHIHLEEDAGKLMHDEGGVNSGEVAGSLVDFNRAGVPLMELVTEPDIHTAEDAVAFMKELQLILRYLGASDADLERGQMRADANISVSPDDTLGTRAEVKNLNSFNSVLRAINYEIKRQTELLERGEKIVQETRGWDDAKQKTTSQRSKEEAQDYRYFPEPDLPPFETSVFEVEKLRAAMPELPDARRKRFEKEYGFGLGQADAIVADKEFADYYEKIVSEYDEWWNMLGEADKIKYDIGNSEKVSNERIAVTTLIYNYLMSDFRGLLNASEKTFSENKISPESFAHLIILLREGKITTRQAKDMLAKMFEVGGDPEEIMKSENVGISESGEVEMVVATIIIENPAAVADYKKGKTASLQFLIGKAMGQLKGRARPDMLKEIFEKNLN